MKVGAGNTAARPYAGAGQLSTILRGPTLKVTGAARLYRAASSDRRERGRPTGWASCHGEWLLFCEAANEHKQKNERRENCQNDFL